ncbi:hypothetical protein ACFSQT_11675 [Mesorhizobium calcicola]|uniref:Uncharacterized protein n=1 Tax=Mesorhizobium calcicola TaxID=1300310 RepID=A0ABW4WAZ5_9HYPH
MDREPVDIQQAHRAYIAAIERLQLVAHYLDRAHMGRSATDSELADIHDRRKAKETALRKICTWPCPDFATLRSKAKILHGILMSGETLGGNEQKALVQSILQMDKATSVRFE